MKKMLAVTAAALAMSVTAALAAPAPVFNTAVKFGEGKVRTASARVAIDGTNLYAAFGSAQLDGNSQAARMVSSTNGGATWKLSEVLQATDANITVGQLSVRSAVSDDPLYPGKKLVHAVWTANNIDGTGSVYYAYKADRPTLTGWSTPVAILTVAGGTEPMGTSLIVTSNGAVHVVASNYYISAPSPDDVFNAVDIPVIGSTPQAVMDASGNIYVVSRDSFDLYLTKKSAGSSIWSDPVTVYSNANGNFVGYVSLAVADANTYYVAYHDGDSSLSLSVTTDGGNSWTKRTVLADQPAAGTSHNPAIAVASGKLTYVTEVFDATGNNPVIKVFRSSDNGASWSAPATIQGQETPSIALDSNNKAHILVRDELGGDNVNLLYIKEK